jgi:hypothetical protein
MIEFDFEELTGGDLLKWDELVDRSPHGTIFHKNGWLEACGRALGKEVKIFGCFQNGSLVGGCSLFLEKKMRDVLYNAKSTCAMTPYGGVVLSSPPTKSVQKQESFSRKIIESLIYRLKQEHYYLISIVNSPEFIDIRPFTLNGWRSNVLYSYYFDLRGDIESRFDSEVKRKIRKAEKNGIMIETSSDISLYYDLLCETYSRKNSEPPAPKRLIFDLYSFIRKQNCGEIVVAKTPEDEIACACIDIWHNKMAYNWSAVSNPNFLNTGAVSFLNLDGFKRMKNLGIPVVNMAMGNIPQLSKFAASYNPTLVPYYQIQYKIFDDLRSLIKNPPQVIEIKNPDY